MKNISFDNPYLLLLFIPLLAAIIIPFAISIRKDNRTKSVIASFVFHIAIALLITLGIAGTVITNTMTETQVIVVADVSYSANRNLDVLDEYIKNVEGAMPEKSKLGIVCFGKDYTLLSDIGGEIKSVKDAKVDDSATNIADALNYATTLFDKGVIKRIVLITDGRQTDSDASSKLITSIENIYAENIYIDAIYLDDNIDENTAEVQISGIDYTKSTYLNHSSTANIIIQSNKATNAILDVYRKEDDGEYQKLTGAGMAITLDLGYNVINYDVPTDASGEFDYRVTVTAEDDTSPYNNEYLFTQRVSTELNVLLVTSSQEKIDYVKSLYGETATIEAHIIHDKLADKKKNVPYTIEDICKFDEIMLYDVDVREINNFTTFIDSVEKAVSIFGKSLVTVGDTKIQNKTDDTLKALEDMLPVKYGNGDQDKKFVTIVIDESTSMDTLGHFEMAKESAKQIVGLLNPGDYISVIGFAGEVYIRKMPVELDNTSEIKKMIDDLPAYHGTYVGAALDKAADIILASSHSDVENKQVFLISDGRNFSNEPIKSETAAQKLFYNGVTTSVIHIQKTHSDTEGVSFMKSIASYGQGEYYSATTLDEIKEVMLSDVANNITETVIEVPTDVRINSKNDSVLGGIVSLPQINGYLYARSKTSANTILYAKYQKNAAVTVDVPLYAYWNYGNGRVASLSTDIMGEWAVNYRDGDGRKFFENILTSNVPKEKVDYPFSVNVDYDGTYSTIEIIPVQLNPNAVVNVKITMPDGEVVEEKLIFDSEKYFYKFATPLLGKHDIEITYSYNNREFVANNFVTLSYSPEYDSFAFFDVSNIYEAIRDRGSVSEDGKVTLENDPRKVATYTLDFTIPFLIAAIALYIIDIIIRKIKWRDIKALFTFRKKKGGI